MVYKQTVQAIIDLFNADASLKDAQQAGGGGARGIQKWYFGTRVTMPRHYPFGYVQFVERNPTGDFQQGTKKFLYDLVFEIGVLERNPDEDEAEKKTYDIVEDIETVLNANPTLSNNVEREQLARQITIIRASEENFAVAFAQVFHVGRKWMSA